MCSKQSAMPSVKSAESEILLGIIRSDSMTSGNSLRTCLLLATILGLLCRTKALPFEYVDEHEDFNYDLDTAQSQAKYDARLLSQQMLSDAELQRQGLSDGQDNALDGDSAAARGTGAGSHLDAVSSVQDDLEPHSRAAACFTNGHKYTHGQKVPRLDACEVCLCMDGEIFCWWEKCDKANVNKARTAGDNAGLGPGVEDDGDGDGNGNGYGDGDYSDPYRHESTTGKSTKVHKAARKVGKRHKHRKNQKNFNDYEVYHSQREKQQQQQQSDYKKSAIKQQLQMQQKHKSDKSGAGNYNIIKQHKHEQQLKIPQQQHQQQQQQQQNVAALGVNHAAKATHYQQAASTPRPTPPPPSPHPQHSHHPHQQPHSSSKILNFPENLPALLYYDYKTEEHEHHQHQHHQQHLLHEKQRLLQQQQQQQLQQQQMVQQEALARQRASESASEPESRARGTAEGGVAPSGDLSADKNSDEAETDSDILPEPPTKQPRAAATQWPTPTSSSSARALMTSNVASTSTAATTTKTSKTKTTTTTTTGRTTTTTTATGTNEMVTSTLSGMEKSGATVAATDLGHMQPDRRGPDAERDDAFHRWLTSTELNADNTNSMDDSLERETPASTIIDDVGTANKSDRSIGGIGGIGGIGKDNGNDAVFFRSSYNDYSSEFNGSVVNIDITLTAVDVHPRRQTDLIANGNRTSGANDNGNSSSSQVGAAGTTMNPLAASTISSISSTRSSSNQDEPQQSPVVPPYTLTTIITTAPLAPGRMCNVLGKLYKIGDILPQDTGNCLQCICTDAVTPDEMPSVTCSPHNCPPLVLPDLFDATGY
ncbi:homeobox protein 13 [Drosophila mauritiana]|uniref:Homeobox protein 13 n=1 Tax=Drosophila mauritiana TaxID=7226 RepID=A0A6P8JNC4_DROMA|nr:homeobox protein 13 [Drosophila mauritiana]XP_033154289.1 homeobox protein 13 [Drosophila mauritiana]XP_033154290.1 homeobox protein 13 [Drosophila mauritiana]XP_033154292.1 homeobox protein 13 [Drosophila mauritiana]